MQTIVVILGAARSGSTLLAKAIGGHSACFTLGEINRFNQEINNPDTYCGCNNKLSKCDFWKQILKDLNVEFNDSIDHDRNNFSVGIFDQFSKRSQILKLIKTVLFNKEYNNDVIEKEIENTFLLYNKVRIRTNSNILVDSTKSLFRALILNSKNSKNFRFKFIHLTRDGRGVLNSGLKSSYTLVFDDGTSKKHKKENSKSPAEVVNSWLYINLRNYIILKLFRKKQTLFIKYEDLTNNPKKYLGIIYNWLDLKFEDSVLNLDTKENHILGGNSSRINAKKINKSDEAWRTNLHRETIRLFNLKAGWLNKILGY